MKGIIFAPNHNSEGRHDASGAFVPGARAFAALHGINNIVWLTGRDNASLILDALRGQSGLGVVAYFGHGLQSGLPSADLWWQDIPRLAASIRAACAPKAQVVLYACTAGKPGCFAERLAMMIGSGVRVWGHTCAGHSFTNPYVTRYPYDFLNDTPYLVEPTSARWRAWHQLIKGRSNIWARYPFMSQATVEREIDTGKAQWIDI